VLKESLALENISE